jgi:hypothetical protein
VAILDFGRRMFFERNLPQVKPNPKKNFRSICQSVLALSVEYKIQDVHLAAILDLGWHWFLKGTFL